MTLEQAYARIKQTERARSATITDARRPHGPIVYCTQSFLAMTGYQESEVIGRNPCFLDGPETDPLSVDTIHQALDVGTPISIDILHYRKNGSTFWNRLTLRPSFGRDGALEHFIRLQSVIEPREVRREPVRLTLA